MSPRPRIPWPVWVFLRLVLPGDRRDEILADLEEGHLARASRMGAGPARRHLYREAMSLLVWRLGWKRVPTGFPEEAPSTRGTKPARGSDLLQDLRFGLRTLLRRPGFSLIVVVILGVGIGAPTTVFTLVDTIFFHRPAHVAEPHRLLRVYRSWAPGEGGGSLANPDFEYYRDNAPTLSGLAAYGGMQVASYSAAEENDQLHLLFTSDNYFDVLGVAPMRGRGFTPEENLTPGTHPVLVLSHSFWVRGMGGDPQVIGSTVRINDLPFQVIGIAPEGFTGISPVEAPPDAWAPIAMFGAVTRASDSAWWERLPDQRERWLSVVGRLNPGLTFEAAESDLMALAGALQYEGKDENEGVLVTRQFLFRPSQQATLTNLSRVLLLVVGFVLVIAAANVAVLLLSRATTRQREIGIRSGLGAGRGRIVRQLLAESLLVGIGGGALGIGLAYALAGLAGSLLPLPFLVDFRPDGRVLLIATILSLFTAVAAGLAPALHAARTDVTSLLHGTWSGTSRSPVRNVLVAGQVALSVILVAGSLLFARSFWTARNQDVGFASANRLIVRVDLRNQGYGTEEGLLFVSEALDRIQALPGVVAATTSRQIPFQGDWTTTFDAPPGAEPNEADGQITTGLNVVGPHYFEVAGIPIVRGRALGAADVQGAPLAVVINETLADQIWPGQDPIGRTLPLSEDRRAQVVGIARTATYYELGEEPFPQGYGYLLQLYQPTVNFIVQTNGPATDLAEAVQATLREVDPTLAFGWVTTMDAVMDDQVARYEVSAVLVGLFSALALLLAASGLYGVVSFNVAQHTREIGVRMALGANRGRVARQVVFSGIRLAAVGLVIGLLGAVALRRLTGSLLYGVDPGEAWPLVGAGLVMLLITTVAASAPAGKATRVDPMEAIRTE